MLRLLSISLVAVGLLAASCGATPTTAARQGPPKATAIKGKLTFVLRGRRLSLVYRGPEKRSSVGYALHNNRVRYSCYTSLWASVGQEEPRGGGVARGRTTKPFPRGTQRKTVLLDRDISDRVGMCVIESLRLDYRFDVAVGMFVPAPELVRRDAPGPPDLSPREGETALETDYVGRPSTPLFLGERSVRIVLTDEAPISVQRDFRTKALDVFCSDRSGIGPGQGSVTIRFPPRSREVVANFAKPIVATEGVTCGAEAGGAEAFGSVGKPGLLEGIER